MLDRKPSKNQTLELIRDKNFDFATILDVGVLTGTPELLRIFPDKHHCLFEPVIEFKQVVADNYKNVSHEFINCAVSNEDGQVTLEIDTIIPGTPISHSAMVEGAATSPSHRTVAMTTLDSFLSMSPRKGPYLLKIDIDGQELKVIEGARLTLQQTSIVMIEATYQNLSARLVSLENHGFELFDIIEPVYYDDALWQCDLIMIKPEAREGKFKKLQENFDPALFVPYQG